MKIFYNILIGLTFLLLNFWIGESYLSILVIIVLPLIFGVIQRFFVGYGLPSRGLFRRRFLLYGLGFGMMLGLVLFFARSLNDRSFTTLDFTIWMLIYISMGGLFWGSIITYKFRELKKKTNGEEDHLDSISDFAIYRDAKNEINRGRLVLSDGKLTFYSSELEGCLFDTPVMELNPVIHRSKFLGIPDGFSLNNELEWVRVNFPYYWMKKIAITK